MTKERLDGFIMATQEVRDAFWNLMKGWEGMVPEGMWHTLQTADELLRELKEERDNEQIRISQSLGDGGGDGPLHEGYFGLLSDRAAQTPKAKCPTDPE